MMRNVIAVGIGTACALALAAATHPALQALSKSEPIPTAGANPISLRAWRLTGTNVEMQVVDSFEGRKYPVRLAYSAPAAGKVDAVSAIPANTLRLYVFKTAD